MSIKDQLKSSHGMTSSFPQLPEITAHIEVKDNPSGGVQFSMYDKAMQTNIPVKAPLKGILIGKVMQAQSYSDHLGTKGGNYRTEYYLNNSSIALFAPTARGYSVVARGSMPEIEAYISKESTGNLKKRQVLFVLTKQGLVAVTTNLTIAIDQLNKYKDELTEKYIVLNPALFDEKAETISKRAKEYLGKLRQKNPPKYAEITVGNLISEDDWDKWRAQAIVDQYKVWFEYKTNGGISDEHGVKEEEQQPNRITVASIHGEAEKKGEPQVKTFDDDLPF